MTNFKFSPSDIPKNDNGQFPYKKFNRLRVNNFPSLRLHIQCYLSRKKPNTPCNITIKNLLFTDKGTNADIILSRAIILSKNLCQKEDNSKTIAFRVMPLVLQLHLVMMSKYLIPCKQYFLSNGLH